ncbi:MAG: hypothetical protein JJD98_15820 [Polaromonas sp.]|nr:hypothetical protein [Polaromonas sp.]
MGVVIERHSVRNAPHQRGASWLMRTVLDTVDPGKAALPARLLAESWHEASRRLCRLKKCRVTLRQYNLQNVELANKVVAACASPYWVVAAFFLNFSREARDQALALRSE